MDGRKFWIKEASNAGENASSIKGGLWQRSCLLFPEDWVSELIYLLSFIYLSWSHRSGRRHEARKALVLLNWQVRSSVSETLGWVEENHCRGCGVAALAAAPLCSSQRCINGSCLPAFLGPLAMLILVEHCVMQACVLCGRQKKIQGLSCPYGCSMFLTCCPEWKPLNCPEALVWKIQTVLILP